MEFGETQARSGNYSKLTTTPDAAVSKKVLPRKARKKKQ